MTLEDLELFYLRQLVTDRLDSLNRALVKYQRVLSDSEVSIKQRKIGGLESEIKVMGALKDKINYDIALLDFGESCGLS